MTDHKQGDLFKINTLFIKVLHDLIQRGELRRLQPAAFAVLCVIRSHVPMTGTSAFPGVKKIGELTGLGRTTVFKALKRLEELDYLKIRRVGRRNVYELREKFHLESNYPDVIGDRWAIARYGPLATREDLRDVEHFAKHGALPGGSNVTIAPINIVFNIAAGDGDAIHIGAAPTDQQAIERILSDVEPGRIKDEVTRILQAVKDKTISTKVLADGSHADFQRKKE